VTSSHPFPQAAQPSEQFVSPCFLRVSQPGRLIKIPTPIPYPDAWALQQQLHAERVAGTCSDVLLLLEHQPVYTMGRRTEPAHLGPGEAALRQTGAAVQPVNRGGSITYHGPGQLVGYPILQLSHYTAGPRSYVRLLEDVLISTLALWKLEGYRIEKQPGVWVLAERGEAKIASIGIRVDRGVTMHGFALNVDLDLTPFSHITPCGLAQCRTTSLSELLRVSIPLDVVADQVALVFSALFNIAWSTPPNTTRRSDYLDRQSMSLG
jgi:lipoyl(octanoyl) transferase